VEKPPEIFHNCQEVKKALVTSLNSFNTSFATLFQPVRHTCMLVTHGQLSMMSVPCLLALWARCSYMYARACLPLTMMRIYICTHY